MIDRFVLSLFTTTKRYFALNSCQDFFSGIYMFTLILKKIYWTKLHVFVSDVYEIRIFNGCHELKPL